MDQQARLDELIEVLVGMPRLAADLVHDHRPDAHGRCGAGCRGGCDGSAVTRHPCMIFDVATAALNRTPAGR